MRKVCLKAVENSRKTKGQIVSIITFSTSGLLNFAQKTMLVRFLNPSNPQTKAFFAQSFLAKNNLLRVVFYPLSPASMATNELNKGFIL